MRPALEAGLRVQPEDADPYMRQVLSFFTIHGADVRALAVKAGIGELLQHEVSDIRAIHPRRAGRKGVG
jgi:hypothetical protein